jgi:uncharacterized protein YjbI with pentapeptide repeats
MANPDHLSRLLNGVRDWNDWKTENWKVRVDLSRARLVDANLEDADLHGANLVGVDATRARMAGANLGSADLREANLAEADLTDAKLWQANLRGARMEMANLVRAELKDADATGAHFAGATLNNANLRSAKLCGADLSGADVRTARLDLADLSGANLRGATLFRTGLNLADLSGATLTGADLRAANLLQAKLNGCVANDVKLWESQRSGWKIDGIVCKRAFWDKDALEPTNYEPGEFERLHAEQVCVELFYQGGISKFELNTLPALLHHLASLHRGANIRLKSIEETGGGAKIAISVGDSNPETFEQIKADTERIQQAQLALRDREIVRLQIQKEYLEDFLSEKLMRAMLTAGGPTNVFSAPVTGVVISSGNSTVDFRQTVNEPAEILDLLRKLDEHRADLAMEPEQSTKLEAEIRTATTELKKQAPDHTILSKSMQFIEQIAHEAFKKAAGRLGDSVATADWSSWLHHLSDFVHHLNI